MNNAEQAFIDAIEKAMKSYERQSMAIKRGIKWSTMKKNRLPTVANCYVNKSKV